MPELADEFRPSDRISKKVMRCVFVEERKPWKVAVQDQRIPCDPECGVVFKNVLQPLLCHKAQNCQGGLKRGDVPIEQASWEDRGVLWMSFGEEIELKPVDTAASYRQHTLDRLAGGHASGQLLYVG
jgi:hypothetical protein